MNDSASGPDLLNDLAHEFAERLRRGERPALTEYTRKYPELAADIRELFPAMVVMEQFGSVAGPIGADSALAGKEIPVPRQLGEYRILREVARGGMGIVYEAVQESLGRHVALKVLPLHGLLDPNHLERFRREAKAAAQLHHTNIVPVFGVGEHEGLHYFAMQFIQGQSLDNVLHELRVFRQKGNVAENEDKQGNVAINLTQGLVTGQFDAQQQVPRPVGSAPSPSASDSATVARHAACPDSLTTSSNLGQPEVQYYRSVARVGLQVADALTYAHQQGVLHRDIKPANLLLDTRGTVWVTDFGLAKAEGTEELTSPGDIVGTIRYMAPERFHGAGDQRSDIFSLGLTLYELATLQPAYAASERAQMIERILHQQPPRPSKVDRRMPRDLETIILKAIAKEPDQRYRSAADLAEDLRRYLADRPIRARQASVWERCWRWCRRNPVVAALLTTVAVLLTVVAVGSLIAYWRVSSAKDEADEAARQALRAERTAQRQAAASILDRALALCEHGESGRGLLWLARGLELAHKAGDADLEYAFRWELGAWTAETHELMLALDYPGKVSAVALSSDGRLVAAAGPHGRVLLWRTDNGEPYGAPLAHPAGVHGLAFLPNTHTLLTGCADGAARLWDGDRGALLADPMSHYPAADQPAREWPFLDGVYAVAVSPDGKSAVTGGCDGTIRLWSLPDGRSLASAVASREEVLAVAFSPDGKTILSGSCDWEVSRWDGGSVQRLGPPRNVGSVVWSLAFTPDGRTVLAGVMQARALLRLDLTAGTQAPPLKHLGGVGAVACTPDGRVLVSGGGDQVTRLWDSATGRPFGPPLPALGSVWSVAVSHDGRFVAVGSEEGAVRLWRLAPGALRRAWRHPVWARCVAFTPDGRFLLAGNSGNPVGKGGETARWEVATGLRVEPTLRHTNGLGWVNGLAVSPDGAFVYTVDSQNQVVHRWEATGKELGVTGRHGDEVMSLALSPDGRRLLTGSAGYKKPPLGCSARLWDAATGAPIGAPMTHAGTVGAIFSPDGKTILTGSHDRTTRLWNAATGEPLGPPHTHAAEVFAVAFHPGGKTVLTGGTDRIAQRWDLATWRPIGPPLVHDGAVGSVGFTRDARLIVTASHDGTARLWHPETGKQVGPSLTHGGVVHQAVCAPDGATLATCSSDGTVRLWALPGFVQGEPAEVARRVTLLTGLSLNEGGTVRVQGPTAWRTVRAQRGRERLTTDRGPAPPDAPAHPADWTAAQLLRSEAQGLLGPTQESKK